MTGASQSFEMATATHTVPPAIDVNASPSDDALKGPGDTCSRLQHAQQAMGK